MSQRASSLNCFSSLSAVSEASGSTTACNQWQCVSTEQRISRSIALLLSLLLHATILTFIPSLTFIPGLTSHTNIKPSLIRVSLSPHTPQIASKRLDKQISPVEEIQRIKETGLPKQIVSQSYSEEKAPLQTTRFLSDKDSYAEKDQIKRGDTPMGTNTPTPDTNTPTTIKPEKTLTSNFNNNGNIKDRVEEKKQIARKETHPKDGSNPQKSVATKDTNRPSSTNSKALFLSSKEFAAVLAANNNSTRDKRDDDSTKSDRLPESESKAARSASIESNSNNSSERRLNNFALSLGSSDYLPDVPDGEVTLLNAKANRYALFVRRVAEKVFGELRASHWRSLGRGDARRASNTATFVATLTPAGKLLSVKMEDSSGSIQFDQTVYQAVQNGAWDQNPPSGATGDDGNIHFVFQSQIRSQPAQNPSGEARWLMLGTGLL